MNNDNLDPIEEETPERYITEKQTMFINLVKTCYDRKEITENFYNHGRLQRCEVTEWNQVFDHFTDLNNQLIHQLMHKDYYLLLERMEKGEAYLAANPGNEKAIKLMQELANQFEGMESP